MIPKYRVWIKEQKKMAKVIRLHFESYEIVYQDCDGYYRFENLRNCVLMQSTGLHDKNGVEIFEGDLLIHEANIFTVEWIRLGFIPVRKCEFGYDRLTNYLIAEAIRIGNIHQNPELLEQ